MIEIIQIGTSGITRYVDILIEYIKNNPSEFVSIARIDDTNKNYSFMALFKDKCTIGKFSALIQEWGTNDGMSGEGGAGFKRMNKFIDENKLNVYNITLSKEDVKKIGYMQPKSIQNWNERKAIWTKYAETLKEYSE